LETIILLYGHLGDRYYLLSEEGKEISIEDCTVYCDELPEEVVLKTARLEKGDYFLIRIGRNSGTVLQIPIDEPVEEINLRRWIDEDFDKDVSGKWSIDTGFLPGEKLGIILREYEEEGIPPAVISWMRNNESKWIW